jgi:hypothetical protein
MIGCLSRLAYFHAVLASSDHPTLEHIAAALCRAEGLDPYGPDDDAAEPNWTLFRTDIYRGCGTMKHVPISGGRTAQQRAVAGRK